jgi:hypothetical protein
MADFGCKCFSLFEKTLSYGKNSVQLPPRMVYARNVIANAKKRRCKKTKDNHIKMTIANTLIKIIMTMYKPEHGDFNGKQLKEFLSNML